VNIVPSRKLYCTSLFVQ